MKVELIRQLTPEERATAMRVSAYDNLLHAGNLSISTQEDFVAVLQMGIEHNEFYARFWDEMRRDKWPQHYFESKTLMAAGPLGWLCWADDD